MLKKLYSLYKKHEKKRYLENYRKQFLSCGTDLNVFGKPMISFGKRISVGNHVNLNDRCVLNATSSKINIGNNCTISTCAMLLAATYDVNKFMIEHHRKHIVAPIEIGDNVWICAGAIICPGVKIESNVIVGAGSVVTHSILESNVIVAGNPAKIIKRYE